MRLHAAMLRALENYIQGKLSRPPAGAEILWSAFCQLSATRSAGSHGPNPISFCEIEAWSRLMRTPLQPHHVTILVAMDRAWLAHAYNPNDGSRQVSGTLSAAAFDAFVG